MPTRRQFTQAALATAAATLLTPLAEAKAQASAPAPTKSPTFDVVSIKPSSLRLEQGGAWGISENKYSSKNTPLIYTILVAYFEKHGTSTQRLIGAPSWVSSEPYDIVAKADEATAQSWKGARQSRQIALAAPLLRAMLEDRFKLAVHTIPTEIAGYELILSKRPLKLKETLPGEPAPQGAFLFEGGWRLAYPRPGEAKQTFSYFNITMTDLIAFISQGTPIVDRTDLKGHYNFDLPKFDTDSPPSGEAAASPAPDAAHMFDWAAIGLEMKPVKVPALNLVVNHIERPTEN